MIHWMVSCLMAHKDHPTRRFLNRNFNFGQRIELHVTDSFGRVLIFRESPDKLVYFLGRRVSKQLRHGGWPKVGFIPFTNGIIVREEIDPINLLQYCKYTEGFAEEYMRPLRRDIIETVLLDAYFYPRCRWGAFKALKQTRAILVNSTDGELFADHLKIARPTGKLPVDFSGLFSYKERIYQPVYTDVFIAGLVTALAKLTTSWHFHDIIARMRYVARLVQSHS